MAIHLYDAETQTILAQITPDQLQQLVDNLEEEFEEDQSYYLNPDTLDYLLQRGVNGGLVDQLRQSMGSREGFEVYWRREG